MLVRPLRQWPSSNSLVALSDDHQVAVFTSGRTVRVHNLSDESRCFEFRPDTLSYITAVACGPTEIALACGNGVLTRWDRNTGSCVHSWVATPAGYCIVDFPLPSGSEVVIKRSHRKQWVLRDRDLTISDQLNEALASQIASGATRVAYVFRVRSTVFALVEHAGVVQVVRLHDARILCRLADLCFDWPPSVAWTSDERRLLVGGESLVQLYNLGRITEDPRRRLVLHWFHCKRRARRNPQSGCCVNM